MRCNSRERGTEEGGGQKVLTRKNQAYIVDRHKLKILKKIFGFRPKIKMACNVLLQERAVILHPL